MTRVVTLQKSGSELRWTSEGGPVVLKMEGRVDVLVGPREQLVYVLTESDSTQSLEVYNVAGEQVQRLLPPEGGHFRYLVCTERKVQMLCGFPSSRPGFSEWHYDIDLERAVFVNGRFDIRSKIQSGIV